MIKPQTGKWIKRDHQAGRKFDEPKGMCEVTTGATTGDWFVKFYAPWSFAKPGEGRHNTPLAEVIV